MAIHQRPEFPIGLWNVREIMPDPARLYDRMRRVEVSAIGAISDAELVATLGEHEQFLCIVNTRPHAARLFEMLRVTNDFAPLSRSTGARGAGHSLRDFCGVRGFAALYY